MQEDEGSEEEAEIESLSYEIEQTCMTRFKEKMVMFMIPPDNKKLRVFHIILAIIFYIDIIMTSLMMGNYHY